MTEFFLGIFGNLIATGIVLVIGFWTYHQQERWQMKRQVYLETLEIIDRFLLGNQANKGNKEKSTGLISASGSEHIPVPELYPMPEEMNKNYNKLALISTKEILTEYLKINNPKFFFITQKMNIINMMREDLFGNWLGKIFKTLAKMFQSSEFLLDSEVFFALNTKEEDDIRKSKVLKIDDKNNESIE